MKEWILIMVISAPSHGVTNQLIIDGFETNEKCKFASIKIAKKIISLGKEKTPETKMECIEIKK